MILVRKGDVKKIYDEQKERRLFTCQYCGCMFVANQGEYEWRTGDMVRTSFCNCPMCGSATFDGEKIGRAFEDGVPCEPWQEKNKHDENQ